MCYSRQTLIFFTWKIGLLQKATAYFYFKIYRSNPFWRVKVELLWKEEMSVSGYKEENFTT